MSARCAALVNASAVSRTAITPGARASSPHPLSDARPPPATRRSRMSRRLSGVSRVMTVLLDAIASGDNRIHVVGQAGNQHHRQMHGEKADKISRHEKMHGARRLPPAKQAEEPGKSRVHRRR